ncbi:TnsA endonuclease N-terminal domain-containing protein [Deefgea piscis]|uniref:TnsA endonuclease N-terminal domain-containing protein n=1 Tax=Deefgea piscis TaxID=2739061 RepID=UPI001C7F517A|nr:TnsA endonuclease N-terminal domain-containing protein [Deefgea piscis]QZA82266.1 TnsA endonuclease N-terminal domain-containing protein [Deefgea piscis]
MGPRKSIWTEEKITRLEREGRGKGIQSDYKPWVQINDLSSLGNSHRVYSEKTKRVHHLLSDIEWHLFLMLEHSRDVLDIREQYPLKREKTLSLAAELDIKHPIYPATKIATVMTCDFLVTLNQEGKNSLRAFSCKNEAGIEKLRDLEKLELERSYFERLGIPYHLAISSQLSKNKIKNLLWCRGATIAGGEVSSEELDVQAEHRLRLIHAIRRAGRGSLGDFCKKQDELAGLDIGSSLFVIRNLLWHRELLTDLNSARLTEQPMPTFKLASYVENKITRA